MLSIWTSLKICHLVKSKLMQGQKNPLVRSSILVRTSVSDTLYEKYFDCLLFILTIYPFSKVKQF